MKLLLVEDEQKIAAFVIAGLVARGIEVTHYTDGDTGFAAACERAFDAIVLDIMLPKRDGLSVLKALRDGGIITPVILLTARNELEDRVTGLGLGADDYLAKPFYVEELVARVHALQRRATGDRQSCMQLGPFILDRLTRQARCRGRVAELTGREFSLLEYLMRSNGQLLTRSQILEHVWGYDFDPSTNVVDVCIKRIRSKLSAMDASGETATLIESVRGTGYRFRPIE